MSDYAKVIKDGFEVPLVGISMDAVLEACELCGLQYPIYRIIINEHGECFCDRCAPPPSK
jgi:hypothetical protein